MPSVTSAKGGTWMIYLFNSAIRPKYVRNVLNTLYLPQGCSNEYRYRHDESEPSVSAALMSKLESRLTDTDCIFIFIDRYGDKGYVYHPLRRAKLLGFRVAEGRLYAKVELATFIYPRDLPQLQRSLIGQLESGGLARLTQNDPENTNDGYYIMESDDIFGKRGEFYEGDGAWKVAVDNLAKTRSFAATEGQYSVFIKAIFNNRGTDDNSFLMPKPRHGNPAFTFIKDKSYELVLTYRFPKQAEDNTAQVSLDLTMGDILRPLASTSFAIDSLSNSIVIPFSSKRNAEDNSGGIALRQSTMSRAGEVSKCEVLLPDASIEYVLEDGTSFWVLVVLLLLTYSVASGFLGADLSKLHPFTWLGMVKELWPKFIIGIIQALSLFCLFRTIGKKVL